MRTLAKHALKRSQLRAKAHGTPVTLKWVEWPQGTAPDPTTGAMPSAGNERLCKTKAFLHFVQPTTAATRMFTEIEVGDCIVDLALPIYRVTDPGDSDLEQGDVLDLPALGVVTRGLQPGEIAPTTTLLDLSTLKDAFVEINGERWVQKQLGKELKAKWDAVFAGIKLSQSLLLRRGT